jgi:hypothetical protein
LSSSSSNSSTKKRASVICVSSKQNLKPKNSRTRTKWKTTTPKYQFTRVVENFSSMPLLYASTDGVTRYSTVFQNNVFDNDVCTAAC